MSPIISKDGVLDAMKSCIPDAEWLLGEIESQNGWFRFPPYLSNVIKNFKIESYPLLYVSEKAMAFMFLRGCMNDEEIRALNAELEAASPEERGAFTTEFSQSLSGAMDTLTIPKTPAEQAEAKRLFDAMHPDDQSEAVRSAQHFFCFFLATFHQNLSVMVHGEKLTSLVEKAKQDDDIAFVKAVQIDKRILTVDPYFRERFERAQMEPGTDFFDALSYRLKTAPYRGKIRHKTLWLAFSLLDQAQLLDILPYTEILEMCDEAGVGGYDNRIQSVKHLGSRIREYRGFQKRGIVTTT